jgi:hypothetical protein
VEVAVVDTLSLENSIARARTLAYLAQTAAKLLEVGELEERLERVEAALGPRPPKGMDVLSCRASHRALALVWLTKCTEPAAVKHNVPDSPDGAEARTLR